MQLLFLIIIEECFILEVIDCLLSMIIFLTQLLFLSEDIFDNGYKANIFLFGHCYLGVGL